MFLLAIDLFSMVLPRWLDMPSGDCFSFAEHDGKTMDKVARIYALIDEGTF